MSDPSQSPTQIPDTPPLACPGGLSNKWKNRLSRFSPWLFVLIMTLESFTLFFTRTDEYPYGTIAGSDGQCYYAFLRSLWIDHDLNFENEFGELNYLGHGRDTLLNFPRSPHTGLLFNRFRIGFALLHVPFFALAHGTTVLGNKLGIWRIAADGYSLPYQFAVLIGAIFWGTCAFESTRRLLNRFFSTGLASLATFLFFLAFQGVFQIIHFPCNPHLQSLFVFNLILILGFRIEDRRDNLFTWMTLGFLIGLLTLLRIECAVLMTYLIPLFFWKAMTRENATIAQSNNRLFSHMVLLSASAGVFVLVSSLQLVPWYFIWGKLPSGEIDYYGGGFNWTHPVFFSVLFSTCHGLFYWTPIALLGLGGFLLFVFSPRAGIGIRSACVPLLVLYYVYAAWKVWWMGYSFGARQFIVISSLFALGFGFLLERFKKQRSLLIAISLLLIFWNHVMMYFFLNGHVPRTDVFHPLLPFSKFLELSKRLFDL